VAWEIDTALGATIVILAIAGFLAFAVGAALARAVRRRATALPAGEVEPQEVVLGR
jgi:zinc transport system permease protein